MFLWTAKLPTSNQGATWSWSALAGAEEAKTTWVRLEANTVSKTYDVYRVLGDLGDTAWPDMTLQEMVDLAFGGDRTISDPDHPVLRELRGES